MTGKARKTTEMRRLIASPELEFLCEAHNGISARIVEEAGFRKSGVSSSFLPEKTN